MKLIKRLFVFLILLSGLAIGYVYYKADQVPDIILRFNEKGVLFDCETIDNECKNKYFYNQLNDEEKLYYQAMYYASINNTNEIEWTFFPDSNILKQAKRAFIEDWPIYYWWNYGSFIYTDKTTISNQFNKEYTYYVSYPENKDTGKMEYNINKLKIIGEYVKEYCYDDNDFIYVKNIHDYITSTITYSLDSDNSQTILGALIDKECVCEGYARAFQYLTNSSGFNCVCVTGLAKYPIDSNNPNINHEWNMIEINDKWYSVDCTWDDVFENEKIYYYFLLNDDLMNVDHYLNPIKGFDYPTCDGLSFNIDEPIIEIKTFDKNDIITFFNKNFEKSHNILTLRFVNIEDFRKAHKWLIDDVGIYDLYYNFYGYYYPKDHFQYMSDEVSHTISIYL